MSIDAQKLGGYIHAGWPFHLKVSGNRLTGIQQYSTVQISARFLFSSQRSLPGLCYFTQGHTCLSGPTFYLPSDPALKGSDLDVA